MIRVFYDSGALFIDGRDDPIPPTTLVAALIGTTISIASIHGATPLVSCDMTQVADMTGNGFGSTDAAMAYLAAQFAMRPLGSQATYTAASAVFGGYALMFAGSNAVEHADPTSAGYVFAGIATQAAAPGAQVAVQQRDVVAFSAWSWTPREPVFALPGGALTQAPPDSGVCHEIGAALDAMTLLVAPRDPLFL